MTSPAIFIFPPFRLDTANEQLWSGTNSLALRPKTYEVLLYFVRNPRRLISKQELLQNVWADVTVSDELLRGYIRELRETLGDDAKNPRYIETIQARGYRLLLDVKMEDASAEIAADPHALTPESKPAHGRKPLRVGILHSLTGTMAGTEGPVVDATLLAIEEINERGGIRGREIQPVVIDGESEETVFARQAERLITQEGVCAIFGCWTSASRKTVLPIVQERNHLLIYPTQYEGMEQCPNIFYTGAAPNQQVIPAVRWAFGFLRSKRFFLVGWNSVYSRATNAIIRDEVDSYGGEILGEEYVLPDSAEVTRIVRDIARSKPDLIFNSLVGDMNLFYTRLLRAAGVMPERTPTVYFSLGETELLSLSAKETQGDYAAWNYFQSLDHETNRTFVEKFRSRYGRRRVIADPMEASYIGVRLWAQAVEAAGSDDLPAVREALRHRDLEAPEGMVRVDPESQHTWKTMRLGRIIEHGQFDVVWSSEKPIRPEPYPSSRSAADWNKFLAHLFREWGGRWTKPQTKLVRAAHAS